MSMLFNFISHLCDSITTSTAHSSSKTKRQRSRALRIEELENREMLSINMLGFTVDPCTDLANVYQDDDCTFTEFITVASAPTIAAAAPGDANADDLACYNDLLARGCVDTDFTWQDGYITEIRVSEREHTGTLDVSGCANLEYLWCYRSSVLTSSNLNANDWNKLKSQGMEDYTTAWRSIDGELRLVMVEGNEFNGTLNLSGCTALEYLQLCDSQLISLNIADCTALEGLYFDNCELTLLNVSGHTALTSLTLENCELTGLNVSGCTSLASLSLEKCELTTLNASGCTALTDLLLKGCEMTMLDISGCTVLTSLLLEDCKLTGLNISGCTLLANLTFKNCELTYLNVSGHTALMSLLLEDCNLIGVNVSGCIALDNLSLNNCGVNTLNVSGCTALTRLECASNRLTELDVSSCIALTYLSCHSNLLKELDMSNNPALTLLNCSGNQLTELDMSSNPALTSLDCSGNTLTSLDLSDCAALIELRCSNNQLTSLDVSMCIVLDALECGNNYMNPNYPTLNLPSHLKNDIAIYLGDQEGIPKPSSNGAIPVKASGAKKSNITLSTAIISWKPNDVRNKFYEVQCISHFVTISEYKLVNGRYTVAITGLNPGISYKFVIISYNGEVPAKKMAKVTVKTKKYVAVKSFKAPKAMKTHNSLTLTWKASPFPETSGYEVLCYNTSGNLVAQQPVTGVGTTTTTFTGLNPSTKYKFEIRAISDQLDGLKSKVSKLSASTLKL